MPAAADHPTAAAGAAAATMRQSTAINKHTGFAPSLLLCGATPAQAAAVSTIIIVMYAAPTAHGQLSAAIPTPDRAVCHHVWSMCYTSSEAT